MPDTEPHLPTYNRSGIVTRSVLVIGFLTSSTIAVILNQSSVTPVKAVSSAASPNAVEKTKIQEIGEFDEGTNLIGPVFCVAYTKDGENMRIPVCIERNTETNDLLFHINGKVFHNDETIPMLGGKATDVIESITCHNGECVRLVSEANGHVDVPYELIRTIVPQLAHAQDPEVVTQTNVTFVPKEGTMISGGQTAMNWVGGYFGKPKTADMNIKSVTFKQIPMGRPHTQLAQHRR